jgi:hypothetical protein
MDGVLNWSVPPNVTSQKSIQKVEIKVIKSDAAIKKSLCALKNDGFASNLTI